MKEVQKGKAIPVNGRMEIIPVKEKDYPKDLKELIKKRKNIYSVKPKFKQEFDLEFSSRSEMTEPVRYKKKETKVVPLQRNTG